MKNNFWTKIPKNGHCIIEDMCILYIYMQNLGKVTTNPDEVNLSANKPRKNAITLLKVRYV